MVQPGSRAELIGIRAGDVLLDYNDKLVRDFISFIRQRESEPVDSTAAKLRVQRAEKILTFAIPPGKIGIGLQGRGIHESVAHPAGVVTGGAPPGVPATR